MRRAALAVALALAAGCHGGATSARKPARDAIDAYAAALRADQPRAAYAMLSDAVKDEVPYEAFALRWRTQRAERAAQAAALSHGLREGAEVDERAMITLDDGTSASLRREAGRWRIEAGLPTGSRAGSPHVAIELFAAALRARSYDDVMRILTARRRDGIGQQVDGFVASLAKQLGRPNHKIDFAGKDRAELGWDDDGLRYRVILLREDGQWRVDDVQIQPLPAPATP